MKGKYSDLFGICKQYGLSYKDIVLQFTDGRTDSLSSLTEQEYDDLIDQLKKLNKTAKKDFKKKPGDPQRKKIISLALIMHWGGGDMKEAIKEIDKWCRKQKFKKGFMQHNEQEYGLLVAIFEQKVYGDFLRDLNK